MALGVTTTVLRELKELSYVAESNKLSDVRRHVKTTLLCRVQGRLGARCEVD